MSEQWHHDQSLRKIGMAVLIFLVLAVMTWVGVTLQDSTKTNQQTHDQVLLNTVKLNQLTDSQKTVNDLRDNVQGLQYRVGNLEQRQAKDDAFRESRGGHGQ